MHLFININNRTTDMHMFLVVTTVGYEMRSSNEKQDNQNCTEHCK